MYSYGSPHMAAQKQDDQLERTFSSYVRIQAVVLKTYLGRWTIGRSGERGSGISVLPARYDDDDIYPISIYVSIYLLREPYPSHHNGLFSPLLVLRDFAAWKADQYRCIPLQVPGSTSAGRVISGTDLVECISVPGDL